MSSIIANVLTELGPTLEEYFHFPGLLLRLRAKEQISEEEKEQAEAEATTFDKSRKLISILKKKSDAALDTILKYFHDDKTMPHIETLIYNSVKKHGYFEKQSTSGGNSSKRTQTRILPSKWWPDQKELIKTFVHRSTKKGVPLVEHVRNLLRSEHSTASASALVANKCVLVGMGGIGKSSTAKWFANTYQKEYDHIIWIDSDSQSLRGSFDRLARKLELTVHSSDELHHFVGDIYEKLSPALCLFIFDNAETFDALQKILPRQELHHSIITSRTVLWGNDTEYGQIPAVQLYFFSKEECLAIFANALGDSGRRPENDVLDLGEQLGFLPLALQTAIATIKNSKQRYTISSYLERIRKDMKFLVQNKALNDYERSISATLRLSIEQIKNEQSLDRDCRSLCMEILNLAACCRPDHIPEYLFHQLPNASHDEVSDALGILVLYSLLADQSSSFRFITNYSVRRFGIHRLLQHVLINGMEQLNMHVIARPILDCAQSALIACSEHTHDHCVHMWNVLGPKLNMKPESVEKYSRFPCILAYYTEHRHPIDYLEKTVQMFSAEFPKGDARLLSIEIRLIYGYAEEGNFIKARVLYEELRRTVEELGDENPRKEFLGMHVDLLGADISLKYFSAQIQRNVAVCDMQDVKSSYEKVLNQLKRTNYNGIIDGIPVYYNLLDKGLGFMLQGVDSREMCFWGKVILNYSRLFCHDTPTMNELAVGVLWHHFSAISPEQVDIDISFLCRLYSLLFPEKFKKADDRIRKIYELAVLHMTRLDFGLSVSPMNDYNCDIFWRIAPPYFRCLLRGDSEGDIFYAVEQLQFLINHIDWPPEGITNYLEHVLEVVDNLIDMNRLMDVVNIARSVLDKLLYPKPPAKNSSNWLHVCLHATLQLNAVYTYAVLKLEEEGCSRSVEAMTAYDTPVLDFIRTNVGRLEIFELCVHYPFQHRALWVLRSVCEKSDFLIERGDPATTKLIFRSKLPILLELVRATREFDGNAEYSWPENSKLPIEAVSRIYDEACYALLYLGELEEVRKLWKECLQMALGVSGRTVLNCVLNVGLRTLNLIQSEVPICKTKNLGQFLDNLVGLTAEHIDIALQL